MSKIKHTRRVWGKRPNTVPPTVQRRFFAPDHMRPSPGTGAFQTTLDRYGDHWPGTSKVHDRAARRRRNRATIAAQRTESARMAADGVDLADVVRDRLSGGD